MEPLGKPRYLNPFNRFRNPSQLEPGKHKSLRTTLKQVKARIFLPLRAVIKSPPSEPPAPGPTPVQQAPPVMNAAPLIPVAADTQMGALPRQNPPAAAMSVVNLVSDDEDDEFHSLQGNSERLLAPGPLQSGLAVAFRDNAAVQQPLTNHAEPHSIQPAAAPSPPEFEHFLGDYILDEAFDDDGLAQVMMDEIMGREAAAPQGNISPAPQPTHLPRPFVNVAEEPRQEAIAEPRQECISTVLGIFPDMCRDHVLDLYNTISQSSDQLIAHVLDELEPYPKVKDKQKNLKRKREVDPDEAAALKYGAVDRAAPSPVESIYIRSILCQEFPLTPTAFVDNTLIQNKYCLFHAYRVLEEAERTFSMENPPYNKLKKPRNKVPIYEERYIKLHVDDVNIDPEQKNVFREFLAAKKIRGKADRVRAAERQHELEEEANELRAQVEGTMSECGCCFGDFPLNRMVHCDGEILHWFCRNCARQTAETEIGNSKYELCCMSMDGCKSGFSNDQRSQFLDEKSVIALERNEQEAVLRMAGIENLASCPFCPFAAEYPPVEVDKEFRCQAPDCEKVSCRLCQLESHIPKSCEEFAKEAGLSVRRQIEEAMSAALIRKCNKCGTPFVKEEGCNKMTCTRNGCRNAQCYICSESCNYSHFNDQSRGGKLGNCPLFDSVEDRHDEEVKKAEKEALEKVRADHPEYTEEDLKIKLSDNVLKDDELRKARDPRRVEHVAMAEALQIQEDIRRQFGNIQNLRLEAAEVPERAFMDLHDEIFRIDPPLALRNFIGVAPPPLLDHQNPAPNGNMPLQFLRPRNLGLNDNIIRPFPPLPQIPQIHGAGDGLVQNMDADMIYANNFPNAHQQDEMIAVRRQWQLVLAEKVSVLRRQMAERQQNPQNPQNPQNGSIAQRLRLRRIDQERQAAAEALKVNMPAARRGAVGAPIPPAPNVRQQPDAQELVRKQQPDAFVAAHEAQLARRANLIAEGHRRNAAEQARQNAVAGVRLRRGAHIGAARGLQNGFQQVAMLGAHAQPNLQLQNHQPVINAANAPFVQGREEQNPFMRRR